MILIQRLEQAAAATVVLVQSFRKGQEEFMANDGDEIKELGEVIESPAQEKLHSLQPDKEELAEVEPGQPGSKFQSKREKK